MQSTAWLPKPHTSKPKHDCLDLAASNLELCKDEVVTPCKLESKTNTESFPNIQKKLNVLGRHGPKILNRKF